MAFRIQKGIITQTNNLKKGLSVENFTDIIKKILTEVRVPYNDPTCNITAGVSTVRYNEDTDKLEKLADPFNHIYTPLNLINDYQMRYNPFQKKLEYFNPTTNLWVTIGVIVGPGEPGGNPTDGIQFEDGSVLVLNDNTILTF